MASLMAPNSMRANLMNEVRLSYAAEVERKLNQHFVIAPESGIFVFTTCGILFKPCDDERREPEECLTSV